MKNLKRRMEMPFVALLGLAAFGCIDVYAQTGIKIQNFSFEDQDPANAKLAAGWQQQWLGYTRTIMTGSETWDQSYAIKFSNTSPPADLSGAVQRVSLNQATAAPVKVTARVKGENIQDLTSDKYGASLYCRVRYANGATDYCITTPKTKNVGTFGWVLLGFNTATFPNGNQPITWIEIEPMLGKVTGTAYFDDVHVMEYRLPSFNGALSIMGDDTTLDQYLVLFKHMLAKGLVGSIAAVTNYLGTSGYMSVAQLHEMQDSGWEVVSHTTDHKDLTKLSPQEMEDQLYFSKKWFSANGFGTIENFAYPFGAYNQNIVHVIQEDAYYTSARGVEKGFNPPGTFPFTVYIQEADSNIPISTVKSWIASAKQNKTWLIILFHQIRTDCGSELYCTSPTIFDQTVTAAQASGLPIVTYSRGLNLVNGN